MPPVLLPVLSKLDCLRSTRKGQIHSSGFLNNLSFKLYGYPTWWCFLVICSTLHLLLFSSNFSRAWIKVLHYPTSSSLLANSLRSLMSSDELVTLPYIGTSLSMELCGTPDVTGLGDDVASRIVVCCRWSSILYDLNHLSYFLRNRNLTKWEWMRRLNETFVANFIKGFGQA